MNGKKNCKLFTFGRMTMHSCVALVALAVFTLLMSSCGSLTGATGSTSRKSLGASEQSASNQQMLTNPTE